MRLSFRVAQDQFPTPVTKYSVSHYTVVRPLPPPLVWAADYRIGRKNGVAAGECPDIAATADSTTSLVRLDQWAGRSHQ